MWEIPSGLAVDLHGSEDAFTRFMGDVLSQDDSSGPAWGYTPDTFRETKGPVAKQPEPQWQAAREVESARTEPKLTLLVG